MANDVLWLYEDAETAAHHRLAQPRMAGAIGEADAWTPEAGLVRY